MKNSAVLQSERFKSLERKTLTSSIELGCVSHCQIFNVVDKQGFLNGAITHLNEDIDGAFVSDANIAVKTLPTMAEFVIWHLLIRVLSELDEDLSLNAQNYQWLATGSPNGIDITALRKSNGQWKFYAIEVKWSEKCDYYNQVRSGLVGDLKKLHRADYSSCRLGTHMTAMKTRLRRLLNREEVEKVFSNIQAGSAPNETQGVEFWGFFVTDWSVENQSHDPNDHFEILMNHAKNDEWPTGSVKGFMLNILDGKTLLSRLSMGEQIP